jgi:hypothetical protein
MDPLHPIVPIAPNIPPITPAPMTQRVNRDSSRSGAGKDQRRQPRPQQEGEPRSGEFDYAEDYSDGEDDSGLHINVTA